MAKATPKPEQTREYTIYGNVAIPTGPEAPGEATLGHIEIATQAGRNHADALRQWGRANPGLAAQYASFLIVTASASKVLTGSTRQEFVVS